MRLYGVLDKSYDDPAAPAPTPVVFLRGAGAPAAVWDDIETAMHRRGLMSSVKARWKDVHRQRAIGQLLPRQERQRLAAQGSDWLATPVTIQDRDADLPVADPPTARHIQNDIIDADQLARAAITQLP